MAAPCASYDFGCIANNCAGNPAGTDVRLFGNALIEYWRTNDCISAYAAVINTDPNTSPLSGPYNYNSEGQLIAQAYAYGTISAYLQTNTLTDDITSPGFNTFQNTLLDMCNNSALPGICDAFLGQYCAGFTREDAVNSPIIRNFCGCYVPASLVYLQYTLGTTGCRNGDFAACTGCTAGNPGCTGQPACDPLCHRAETVQKANLNTGNIISCPQSICVIDDITVNVSNSKIPGGINFNSVCSGCKDNCLCVVSGNNVSTTAANIGLGVNFDQFCGANSVCLTEDNAGNIVNVEGCTGINPVNIGVNLTSTPNAGITFLIILLVILVIIIIFVLRYN